MPANLKLVDIQNFPVKPEVRKAPGRKTDEVYGRADRKHLTEAEVAALIEAAKKNRHGNRDRLAIALAFHHGLRVSELVRLSWAAIDLDAGTITIVRKKGGMGGTHPLDPDCHRRLTALKKAQKESKHGLRPWVFVTERNTQMTVDSFADQLKAAAVRAGLTNVHPHSLRHACGHMLAESNLPAYKLQPWLGHRKAESTAIYIDAAARQHEDAAAIMSGKGIR
jgi:integrase